MTGADKANALKGGTKENNKKKDKSLKNAQSNLQTD
jgi:hypothetical protein